VPDAGVDGPSDAAIVDGSLEGKDAPSGAAVRASDVPIEGLDANEIRIFNAGDSLFELVFREPDGLGPNYIRTSCAVCHAAGARGPGLVQKFALVEADGITPLADQTALAFGHTVRQGLTSGATTPLLAPAGANVKVTTRVGPPIFGRGYMEAIDDKEIERQEANQALRTDGIHGKINRITYVSMPNTNTRFGAHATGETHLIGRFGLKARVVSLDDFTADAFQGDMGMTTPMRPNEPPNPDGLIDDRHPGVDLTLEHVNQVADYLRLVAIPVRVNPNPRGREWFEKATCTVCHAPALKTRADYPIRPIAGIDAPVYTDMLLHDMGPSLADGQTDGSSTSRQWRTAPLIGLRFNSTFLHDGRVTSVEQAIMAHDGEAKPSADFFATLPPADREALVRFTESL
jgi:CxxC motif-containing protein (DUF1111 family)